MTKTRAIGLSSRLLSEPTPEPIKLSVVVVTHESADEVSRSLPAIAAELRPGDQLIVCDNASTDGTRERVGELAIGAELLELGSNLGFGAACNAGARAAEHDLLLFLNPDAVVEPGFRDAIELPLVEHRGWDAWQPLLTAAGGSLVNSWGGVVHFTGIAWAGGAGRASAEAPVRADRGRASPPAPAWPCDARPGRRWPASARSTSSTTRTPISACDCGSAGAASGSSRAPVASTSYEFEKGPHKWYYLERNRYATIIRTYPSRLWLALLPGLLATELALLVVAALGGWLGPKLRADRDVVRALPRLVAERAQIADLARAAGPGAADAGRFADLLTPDLDSNYLGSASQSSLLRALTISDGPPGRGSCGPCCGATGGWPGY